MSTTTGSEQQSLSHHPQQAVVPTVESTPIQGTPASTHQFQPQSEGIENYRIHVNSLEKKSGNIFLNPRFLSPNSMLGARFQWIPNITAQIQQTAPEEIVTKMKEVGVVEEEGKGTGEDHTCGVCQKVFTTKQYLKRHEAIHHSLVVLSCPVCSKYFDKKTALNRHMLSHTSLRPHVCEECGKGLFVYFFIKFLSCLCREYCTTPFTTHHLLHHTCVCKLHTHTPSEIHGPLRYLVCGNVVCLHGLDF